MLLSVQTAPILDKFGIDEGFAMIAEAGFQAVDFNIDHCLPGTQIRAHELHGFFDQTDEEMIEAARPYKEAAEKYGIQFTQAHAPFPNNVGVEATNEYVLKAVKKTIMIMGYLNCPRLVVHPGFLPYDAHQDKDAEWDFNIRMYSALIPDLKKYGVTCCLENMFGRHRGKIMQAICSDPYEAASYIDELNEIAGEKLFGFCLDTGHVNLVSHDQYEVIKTLGDRIVCLHVHDNNGMDDEHLFPYMGVIDWDGFCRGLREIGYHHDFSFETFNAVETFDYALTPQLLSLLHATGELFVSRIQGE